jgi:hypothetical protein
MDGIAEKYWRTAASGHEAAVHRQRTSRDVAADRDPIKTALKLWTGGEKSAERKLKLFEDRLVDLALDRLATFNRSGVPPQFSYARARRMYDRRDLDLGEGAIQRYFVSVIESVVNACLVTVG